jgi:hypothetical protein
MLEHAFKDSLLRARIVCRLLRASGKPRSRNRVNCEIRVNFLLNDIN